MQRRLNRIDVLDASDGDRSLPSTDSVYVETTRMDSEKPRLHLLAVGISDYGDRLGEAVNSQHDADAFFSYMRVHSESNYVLDRDSSRLLIADDVQGYVTRSQVLTAIRSLAGKGSFQTDSDTIVFYFAGHGTVTATQPQRPEFYFVLPDPDLQNLQDAETLSKSSLSLDDLRPLLELPCQKLFIVDACRSGHLLGAPASQAEDAEKLLIRSLKERRAMILTATSDDGIASGFLADRPLNGLFTGLLLQGLEGFADKYAGNSDGSVTLREAVDYVRGQMSARPEAYSTDQAGRVLIQSPLFAPSEVLDIYDLPLGGESEGSPE